MLVLCYHKVNNCINDDWNQITVKQDVFFEQMRYLKDNFKLCSTNDVALGKENIAITFDDGYEDFYVNAFPIISEMNIPVTIFVTTGNIDSENEDWCNELSNRIVTAKDMESMCFLNHSFEMQSLEKRLQTNRQVFKLLKSMNNRDRESAIAQLNAIVHNTPLPRPHYKYLSSEMLYSLSKSNLVTIGAHTVTHPSLASLLPEELDYEITASKNRIERIIGRTVDQFAYPFGGQTDYDEEVIKTLIGKGFKLAFTTSRKQKTPNNLLYEISRVCISENDMYSFVEKINSRL